MNAQPDARYVPSPYATIVASRGQEIASNEMSRLEKIVEDALRILHAAHPARVALLVGRRVAASCASVEERLDTLSSAIVEAQRMVLPDSAASAVLFLDGCKRRRWSSYQAYLNDLDDRVHRIRQDA